MFQDVLIGGGILVAIITGLFATVHILVNKKVSTPADKLAKEKQTSDETAQLLKEIKEERAGLADEMKQVKSDLAAAVKTIGEQGEQINELREEALQRDHYIYRAVGVIERVAGRDAIPLPHPPGLEF